MISSAAATVAGMPGWKCAGIRGGRAAAEPSPGAWAKRAGSAKLAHMGAEPTVGSMTAPLADTVGDVDVWNRRLPGTCHRGRPGPGLAHGRPGADLPPRARRRRRVRRP